jgi:multidrug resistance efflux pump
MVSYARRAAVIAIAVLGLAGCRGGLNGKETVPSGGAGANGGNGVGCMGRILPENGTISVSPYSVGGGTPVVEQLLIKPGDWVAKGQEIATLRSRPFLEKAVLSAEAQVLSKSQIESLQSRLGESEALLTQAREHLREISAARPEDIAIATAELKAALADLSRARQDASSSIVRSPVDARVLQITAHPGEPVGPQGLAELAETGKMQVVAEVYETDITRVHIGQKATITSDLLPQPLTGTVVLIGSEIARQEPLSADPGAPADARVFQVRIDVSEQSVLAERINGKVNVVVHP